jgi:hypothetical protein
MFLGLGFLTTAQGSDLDLAHEFLYCGDLKMRVARMNKDAEAGKREVEKAEELTLVSVAALIPIAQMDAELAVVQAKLGKDIARAIQEGEVRPTAVSEFLAEKKLACDKLQSERGREMYQRGVEVLSPSKDKKSSE